MTVQAQDQISSPNKQLANMAKPTCLTFTCVTLTSTDILILSSVNMWRSSST